MESSITGHRAGVSPFSDHGVCTPPPPVTCTQITAAEASKCISEREGGAGLGQAMVQSTGAPADEAFHRRKLQKSRARTPAVWSKAASAHSSGDASIAACWVLVRNAAAPGLQKM